jgi:hypothetical protein
MFVAASAIAYVVGYRERSPWRRDPFPGPADLYRLSLDVAVARARGRLLAEGNASQYLALTTAYKAFVELYRAVALSALTAGDREASIPFRQDLDAALTALDVELARFPGELGGLEPDVHELVHLRRDATPDELRRALPALLGTIESIRIALWLLDRERHAPPRPPIDPLSPDTTPRNRP